MENIYVEYTKILEQLVIPDIASMIKEYIFEMCSGTYIDGKSYRFMKLFGEKHGKYEEWHTNGKRSTSCTYNSGCYIGELKQWYQNGQLESRHMYDNDENITECECYYHTGDMRYQLLTDGSFKEWDEHNTLRARGHCNNSVYIGCCERFDANGVLVHRVFCGVNEDDDEYYDSGIWLDY